MLRLNRLGFKASASLEIVYWIYTIEIKSLFKPTVIVYLWNINDNMVIVYLCNNTLLHNSIFCTWHSDRLWINVVICSCSYSLLKYVEKIPTWIYITACHMVHNYIYVTSNEPHHDNYWYCQQYIVYKMFHALSVLRFVVGGFTAPPLPLSVTTSHVKRCML